jgi:phosphate-selective porin OprO/OprP
MMTMMTMMKTVRQLTRRNKHKDTKAQRHKESRHQRLFKAAFFVPLCLCVFVFDNHVQAQDQPQDSGFRFVFNNRPSFRFGNKLRVDVRVKSQADIRAFSPDVETDEGEFDLQRVRFGLEGNFLNDFEYEIEREFRNEIGGRFARPVTNPWRDTFINFRRFGNFQVRAGKFKVPFSVDQLTSAQNLDFVLRSRVADELAPGRDVGVTLRGRFYERGLSYEAGIFRRDGEDENAEAVDAESRGRRMYAARVTGMPLRLLDVPAAFKTIEVGIAGTSSNIPEGLSGLRGRSALLETFFPRVYVRGTRFRLGTELTWTPGPFSLKGEFIHARDQRENQSIRETDLPELIARGWYVSGTWAITGENKADGIEPRRPLFDGGFGAIEFAARYEQIRFGSSQHIGTPSRSPRASNILGNSDRVWTAGVNWYPNRFTKIQINGVHDRIEDLQRTPIADRANYWMGILRLQFVM